MDFKDMCPRYLAAMSFLGKKWTGLILRSLMEGPRRFTEMSAYVPGLSDRLLSQRLQELEEAGIAALDAAGLSKIAARFDVTCGDADVGSMVKALLAHREQAREGRDFALADEIRAALAAGRHVATTNKGPVALAWAELSELARVNDVQLRCEGTVMSGTPLLNVCEGGLAGAGVYSVRGILNGTCNFVLCRMEDGIDYDEALAEAQQLGYAETDPSADVDGWDAAAKVAILGNIVLGGGLTLSDVSREGIVGIDRSDVECAAQQGNRLRLVGSVRVVDGAVVDPKVAVAELPLDDPLAQVRGPGNLLTFETQALGPVSIAGPGAGRAATGHALIADLVAIQRRLGL